jgi:hypothetical protein
MIYTIIQADVEGTSIPPIVRYKSAGSAHLKRHGWTQDQAARHFNVTVSYLCRVLNGQLKSQRLVRAVMALGPNPLPSKRTSYSTAA